MTQALISARGPRLFLWLVCLAGFGRLSVGMAIPIKGQVAQVLLERAFDRSLALHRPAKPWPWADIAPAARLRVPRLGVDQIVLDSASGQALAFGPALLPGASGLGGRGTAVIAAHRDTQFRFLGKLRPGDLIEILTIGGARQSYRVNGSGVVRWDRFALPQRPYGLILAPVTR